MRGARRECMIGVATGLRARIAGSEREDLFGKGVLV